MTLEADEKRFITLRNGLWVIGFIVVVGFIAGAFLLNRSQNAINALSSQVQGLEKQVSQLERSFHFFALGDTPVVLIGGSVDLQSKTKTNWQPETTVPGGYYATGENPIGTISIKNFAGDSEFTRVMTNEQSWVVTVVGDQANAITVSQAVGDPTIHVAPVSGPLTLPSTTKLHYHKHGMRCPGGKDDCDNLQTVSITVNNIPRGTFTCTNGLPTPSVPNPSGKCRVEFVEGK
jgi:hypothetical protein